jgi:DNA-binding transcriptional LysR family regulator
MLANGQLAELFPEWSEERFPLYALYPSKTHLPAKTRAFIDFVLSLTEKEEHLSLHVGHNERS